jgi:RHS repeat-associated protein/uncharacterized delta-60 repeat protein
MPIAKARRGLRTAVAATCQKLFRANTKSLAPASALEPLETRTLFSANVVAGVWDFLGQEQAIQFTFDRDMSGDVTLDAFELLDKGRDTVVPNSAMVLNFSSDGTVARITWPNLPADWTLGQDHWAHVLPTGLFDARLDAAQSNLDVDAHVPFSFMTSDFSGDLQVDFDDLVPLAQNYGKLSGATFAQGDGNYDGKVNFDDLVSLAQRYNSGPLVFPPTSPGILVVGPTRATEATLMWSPTSLRDVTGYKLLRSLDGITFDSTPRTIVAENPAATYYSFADSGLLEGQKYWYKVVPFNESTTNGGALGDRTAYLKKAAITVLPMPFGVGADEITSTSAVLHWTDNSHDETGFRVYQSVNGGPFTGLSQLLPAHAGTGTAVWQVGGLNPNSTYAYRIQAVTGAQTSAPTLPVQLKTLSTVATDVKIKGPHHFSAGDTVFFDALGGPAAGAGSASYLWRISRAGKTIENGSGTRFEPRPLAAGAYIMDLTVVDGGGGLTTAIPLSFTVAPVEASIAVNGHTQVEAGRIGAYAASFDLKSLTRMSDAQWADFDWDESVTMTWTLIEGQTTTVLPSNPYDEFSVAHRFESVGNYKVQLHVAVAGWGTFVGTKIVSVGPPDTSVQLPTKRIVFPTDTVLGNVSWDEAHGGRMVPLSNGQFLIAGWLDPEYVSQNPPEPFAVIARLNADLSIDTDFGPADSGGLVLVHVDGDSTHQYIDGFLGPHDFSIDVDAAENIYIAAHVPRDGFDVQVIKLSPSGILDESYGSFVLPGGTRDYRGAMLPLHFNAFQTYFSHIRVQEDGAVLLFGSARATRWNASHTARLVDGVTYAARLNPDGTPDNGVLGMDSDPSSTFGSDAELFEDNVSTGVETYIVPGLALLNVEAIGEYLTWSGTLSSTFVPDYGAPDHNNFPWASLFTDGGADQGRYLVAMESFVESDPEMPPSVQVDESGYQFGIVAMSLNGEVDTSWGDNGRFRLGRNAFGISSTGENEAAAISSMTQLPDGSVLAIGLANVSNGTSTLETNIGVIKLTPDGDLDTSFGPTGGAGRILAPVEPSMIPWAVDTDEQGRIYITGTSTQGGFLLRLTSDGIVDTSFDPADATPDGFVYLDGEIVAGDTDPDREVDWVAISVSGKGVVTVGGVSKAHPYLEVARYKVDDIGAGDLIASPEPEGSVLLRWRDLGEAEDGFVIRRATTLAGLDSPAAATIYLPSDSTSYQDVMVQPDTRYFYRVSAFRTSTTGTPAIDGPHSDAEVSTYPVNTGFVIQDSIDIPVDGSEVTSHIELSPSAFYQLQVSGYFDLANNGGSPSALQHADAEYGYRSFGYSTRVIDIRENSPFGDVDYGVGVRADSASWPQGLVKAPFWGPPSTDVDHTYVRGYRLAGDVGTDAPLVFRYNDNYYADNEGVADEDPYTLTMQIYRAGPGGPTALTAEGVRGDHDHIDLHWKNLHKDPSGNETKIYVERGTRDPVTHALVFARIATLPGDSTAYSDFASELELNTPYIYRVQVENSFAASRYSNEVSAALENAPPVIKPIPEQAIQEYMPFTMLVDAEDPEDGVEGLWYEVRTGPAGLQPALGSPSLSGLLSGWELDAAGTSEPVVVRVTDKDGAYSEVSFSITATPRTGSLPQVLGPAHEVTAERQAKVRRLAVTAIDDGGNGGDADLRYTWSVIGKPLTAKTPTFEINGTNAAKNVDVTFSAAGTYKFRVTINDETDFPTVSEVEIQVAQILSRVDVIETQGRVSLALGEHATLVASAADQFGNGIAGLVYNSWSVDSSGSAAGGTVVQSASPLLMRAEYTAPSTLAGVEPLRADVVRVTALAPPAAPNDPAGLSPTSLSGTATLKVQRNANDPPEIDPDHEIDARVLSLGNLELSIRAVDPDGDSSKLQYIWNYEGYTGAGALPSGFQAPRFEVSGTNAAQTTIVYCDDRVPFSYNFSCTARDELGGESQWFLYLGDERKFASIDLSPKASLINASGLNGGGLSTREFHAYANDDFGRRLLSQTSGSWEWHWFLDDDSVSSGSEANSYTFVAPTTSSTHTVRVQAIYTYIDGGITKTITHQASTTIRSIAEEPATLKITAPTDEGGVITRATPVELVAVDPNGDLVAWKLWLRDSRGNRSLLTGGSAVGTLPDVGAQSYFIEPTALMNDTYTLELTETTLTGDVTRDTRSFRVDTKFKVGPLSLPFVDTTFTTPAGDVLEVKRVYDSSRANEKSEFGYGWHLELNKTEIRTTAKPSVLNSGSSLRLGDLVYVTIPGDGEHVFAFMPRPVGEYPKQAVGLGTVSDPFHLTYAGGEYLPQFVCVDGSGASLQIKSVVEALHPSDYNLRVSLDSKEFYRVGGGQTVVNPQLSAFGGKYLLKTADGSAYEVAASTGSLLSKTDPNGNVTQYDGAGSRYSVKTEPSTTDSSVIGRAGIWDSAANGGLGDWLGGHVDYHYDIAGQLDQVTDPSGVSTYVKYYNTTDAGFTYRPHFLKQIETADHKLAVKVEYDANGMLSRMTDGAGNATDAVNGSFNGTNMLRASIDPSGAKVEQKFSDRGDVIREIKTVLKKDGSIEKFIVSTSEYAYQEALDDDYIEEIEFGRAPSNALRWITRYADQEILGADAAGLRYTQTTNVVMNRTTFYTDFSKPQSYGLPAFDESLDSHNVLKKTEYFDYVHGSPQVIRDADGNYSYSKYDAATGNLLWSLDGRGEGTLTVYSGLAGSALPSSPFSALNGDSTGAYKYPGDGSPTSLAGLAKGVVLATYRVAASVPAPDATAPTLPSVSTWSLAIPLTANRYYPTTGAVSDGSHGRLWKTTNLPGTSDAVTTITTYGIDGQVTSSARSWTESGIGHSVIDSETVYDSFGRVIRTYAGDSSLVAATKTYFDANGRPVVVVDPFGGQTVTTYDVAGRVIRTNYADHTEVRTVFDASGRMTWTSDRFVSTVTPLVTLNDTTHTATVTIADSNGAIYNVSRSLYDSLGRAIGTERYRDASINLVTTGGMPTTTEPSVAALQLAKKRVAWTETTYDGKGRVETTTDAAGKRTGTSYYSNGQSQYQGLVTRVNSGGTAGSGWILLKALPGGAADYLSEYATYTYGESETVGDLPFKYDTVTTPDKVVTKTSTSIDGKTTIVTRWNLNPIFGGIESSAKTIQGSMTAAAVPSGELPSGFVMISGGNHQVAYDALGNAAHRLFDISGHLVDVWLPVDDATTTPPGKVWSHWHYNYDSNGNQSAQIDPRGKVTSFVYDDHGRRLSRTLPADSDGSLTNDTERWTYDAFGRTSTHVDFKGQTERSYYDDTGGHGGRVSETARFVAGMPTDDIGDSAEVTAYEYDDLDRQAAVSEGSFDEPGATRIETTTFDPITGGIASVTSPEGVIHYEYDPATGRKIRTWTDHNDTIYRYDVRGRLIDTIALVFNSTRYGTYTTLNAEGNPLFDDLPANQTPALTTSNAYDAGGNLDLVTMPTGNTEDYVYDGLGRLEHVIVKNGVNDVFRQDYTLRDDGSRASVIERRYVAGSVAQKTKISWEYDDQGHLTKETRDGDTTPGDANDNFDAYETIDGVADYIDDYGFDLAGNRITKDHDAAGTSNDETVTSTYNDRDQLRIENSTVHGRSADDYDANGSLIAKRSGVDTLGAGGSTVETYAWDLRGRMTSATVGTATTTFGYDSTGVRTTRTVGSNPTTKFLNDKLNPTGYAKAIEESTSAGVQRSYVFGLDILMQADVNGTFQLIKDGHGATRALVNLAGMITQVFEFDAYAKLINMSMSTAKTEWLAPDGRQDVSTGLNYNLARYVNPETGTFLSFDSFEGDVGSPAALHKYAYLGGNPTSGRDSSGHQSASEMLTVVGNISRVMQMTLRVTRSVQRAKAWLNFAEEIATTIKALTDGEAQVAIVAAIGEARRLVQSTLAEDDPISSLEDNLGRLFKTSIREWIPSLAVGFRKINRYLIYMPLPVAMRYREVGVTIKKLDIKVNLVFGGPGQSKGRVMGMGFGTENQRYEMWRMDFHPMHLVEGPDGVKNTFSADPKGERVWRDGPFHYHVNRGQVII